MRCLEDILCGKRVIIGIRDYKNCAKSESGLYINDIPGITLKNATSIVTEEQKSGYELLNNIIKQAIRLTFEDFYGQVSPAFAFNLISETRHLDQFDPSILPPVNLERGLVLKRWRSEMAQIFVSEVYVKSASSGVFSFKILDGDKVTTFSNIALLANQVKTVRVDYMADQEQIKIIGSDNLFSMYGGPIQKGISGCGYCGGSASDGFFITGWNGTKEESRYFGIGVHASVRCYEENVICQLLNKMFFLFWYRAGMLYYEDLLSSNRLNPITLYTKELAQKNLDMLTDKYEKAFKTFIPTIQTFLKSTKGECFTCNPSIRYAISAP